MAQPTVPLTHYWLWDGDQDPITACGRLLDHATQAGTTPTCPTCAAYIAADNYCTDLLDAFAVGCAPPLVAEVTAQAAQRTLPLSPFGDAWAALAVKLQQPVLVAVKAGRR